MTTDAKKFPHIYRGVVVNNVDLTGGNRIMVRVQDVLGGDPCIWCEPVTAIPGMVVVPKINDGVVVQFTDGDIDRAKWTGFWPSDLDQIKPIAAAVPPGVPKVVMGTSLQNSLLITDAPGPTGGIQLQIKAPGGPSIKISEVGIVLSAGPAGASITITAAGILINGKTVTIAP
ncbi:baseplate assembly protein [Nocardia abscessus]|uniref:phage baseplate assembly protein V n=1 Tax=Nocardia abscessus TaxID=120957 RepID=UPI001895642E|nr:phage baseplate assembly protein V [Nocardia abscessus]MBF6336852.1 baseplate assembly protein [Nocardia abscessus]